MMCYSQVDEGYDFCDELLEEHGFNVVAAYAKDLKASSLANSMFACGFMKRLNEQRERIIHEHQ